MAYVIYIRLLAYRLCTCISYIHIHIHIYIADVYITIYTIESIYTSVYKPPIISGSFPTGCPPPKKKRPCINCFSNLIVFQSRARCFFVNIVGFFWDHWPNKTPSRGLVDNQATPTQILPIWKKHEKKKLNQKAKNEKIAENAHKKTFMRKFMEKITLRLSLQPLPKHFPDTNGLTPSIAELSQPQLVPFSFELVYSL